MHYSLGQHSSASLTLWKKIYLNQFVFVEILTLEISKVNNKISHVHCGLKFSLGLEGTLSLNMYKSINLSQKIVSLPRLDLTSIEENSDIFVTFYNYDFIVVVFGFHHFI